MYGKRIRLWSPWKQSKRKQNRARRAKGIKLDEFDEEEIKNLLSSFQGSRFLVCTFELWRLKAKPLGFIAIPKCIDKPEWWRVSCAVSIS